MIKVYLASPWFNPIQKDCMDRVRNLLLNMKCFEVYAPYYDGIKLSKDDSPENRQKVFDENIRAIVGVDLLVVVIDDFDPGSIFEMGVAYRGNNRAVKIEDVCGYGLSMVPIPIIAYSDVSGRGLNVMLQRASWGFANGLTQLREQLQRYVDGKEPANFLPFIKGDVQ